MGLIIKKLALLQIYTDIWITFYFDC